MIRVWQIIWFEYWHNIKRPGYLLITFVFPLFIIIVPTFLVLLVVLAFQLALPKADRRPVGWVDEAGLLTQAHPLEPPDFLIYYASTKAAVQALEADHLQAYVHLAVDYWETGQVTLTYHDPPSEDIQNKIRALIHSQVRSQVPKQILRRYDLGANIIQHGVQDEETFSDDNLGEWAAVFAIIYFTMQANIFTSVRVFDSIASEADNRTIEILITTVTPLQFVVGKLVGLIAVGLTQLGIWGGAVFFLAWGVGLALGLNIITVILQWEHLWFLVSFLLATHLMNQILAAAFGLLRVSGGMGVQLINIFGWILTIALLYALYFIPRNPSTLVAVISSLIPLTAPMVLPIRVVVSSVPTWQIIVAQGLLWGTNMLGILWVRRLLQANLVKYAPQFQLWQWLRRTLVQLWPNKAS